jgi:hypothetical protein
VPAATQDPPPRYGRCEPLAQQRRQVLAPGPAGAPPPAPRSAYPAGPSVALPVQPHEDIALREIGPVEVLWGCCRAPSSNSTGVSRSAEMARATARRSSASSPCSPTVELTNTRRRWSGVWITTSARILRSLIVPGRPTPVWDEPARAGDPPSFILRRFRFDAEVGGVLAGEDVGATASAPGLALRWNTSRR